MLKKTLGVLAAGLLAAAGAQTMSVTGASAQPPDWAGGQAALDRLGDQLPAVAAANDLSTSELRSHLLNDRSLFVDQEQRLVYIDQVRPAEAATATDTTAVTDDPATTFALHSRPGSPRVIYLDFDGHTVSGTAWNGSTGGQPCHADAYDTDGAPQQFSDAELAVVRGVWARVAEDFAGLDVNVTTADPGSEAITRSSSTDTAFGTRALISNSTTVCANGKTLYASVCANGCGGVAYVGVFDAVGADHPYYQPAFVFQNGVGGGQKNIAEAASHEVGHNLGLSHDGTRTTGYYTGHGSWAPIMGVGYYEAITQWSRGEYSGANNTQDDFYVMQTNGAPTFVDDHVEDTPTPLSPDSPLAGIIANRADKDAFTFTVAAGSSVVTIEVAPAGAGPNLDAELTLSGPSVSLFNNPDSGSSSSDVSTGMGASLTATLGAGTYVATIDGVGYGDPKTSGYSDYGSGGAFTISLTVAPADDTPPPPASLTLTATAYKTRSQKYADLRWNATAGNTYQVLRNGTAIATTTSDAYTDGPLGRREVTANYRVCTTGATITCSNTVAVTW